MANKVVVFCLNKRFRRLENGVKRAALGTLSFLKKDRKYLEVYLVPDSIICSLNLKFRKKDKPADVLSFEGAGGFPEPDLPPSTQRLGEVYLAPDCIGRKGGAIERLTAHGVLHLLGYTHNGGRAGKIREKENRIYKALNF